MDWKQGSLEALLESSDGCSDGQSWALDPLVYLSPEDILCELYPLLQEVHRLLKPTGLNNVLRQGGIGEAQTCLVLPGHKLLRGTGPYDAVDNAGTRYQYKATTGSTGWNFRVHKNDEEGRRITEVKPQAEHIMVAKLGEYIVERVWYIHNDERFWKRLSPKGSLPMRYIEEVGELHWECCADIRRQLRLV